MSLNLTVALIFSGLLASCATEGGHGKHEQTPNPQPGSPSNQEPPPSSPPAPAGGISSSGDQAPCIEAPSVIGKIFTRSLQGSGSCESMAASGAETSCKESLNFIDETHADVLFGGSDIVERVPFSQSGNCIQIDLSQSSVYRSLGEQRSSWRLATDALSLVSSSDGVEFRSE